MGNIKHTLCIYRSMLKKFFGISTTLSLLFVPFIVSAQTSFDVYVYNLIIPLRDVVPLLVGVAVVVFIWGVIKYLSSSEDPTKKEGARRILVIGVVGIFVLVSLWGIVTIILTIFFGGVPGESPFFTEPPQPISDPGNLVPNQPTGNSGNQGRELCIPADSPFCNILP